MTEPAILYRVSYSERVRQRLRELANEAEQRGDTEQFAAALKELDRRLHLYPQFGEPYLDLTAEPGQMYKGIVRPLAMRYAVYEDRRFVLVGAHPELLPMDREESDAGPDSTTD